MGLLEVGSDVHIAHGYQSVLKLEFPANDHSELTLQHFAYPGESIFHGTGCPDEVFSLRSVV
jgi:hypothetical protein